MASSFGFSSCSQNPTAINGKFLGSVDGKPDATISLLAGTTGDYFTTGIWESNTSFKTGEISTRKNYFGSLTYTLTIKEGACTGDFPVHLTAEHDKIIGDIDGGKQCPDEKIHFTLNLSSAKV